MDNIKSKSVGAMVAEDYRTAAVFKRFGIDFCCKGQRTVEEVCNTKEVDYIELTQALNQLNTPSNELNMDYNSWPLDLLIDYIEKKHHRYVVEATEQLTQYLDKICKVHGHHHQELIEIKDQFMASAQELAKHMKKEELVLFPYVRKTLSNVSKGIQNETPGFGTVNNPIQVMMDEHEVEGNRFRTIAQLSNNYTPPEEACNTYRVAFALLQEFENDLHLHIHLENNILFPKAIQLEKMVLTN